ncbi:MAG: ArsR/SmtB family transcription factor [Nitrososphaerales archaeon]
MSLNGFGRLVTFVSSSEVRSKVLLDLSKGPMTPTELASVEGKHVSHVSRALAELRAEGLVEPVRTSSRERYYRATDRGLSLSVRFMKMPK